MLDDWTNEGPDPLASTEETGSASDAGPQPVVAAVGDGPPVPVAQQPPVRRGVPFLGVPQRAWQHVIALSGIRGGISIALALSLPHALPFRDEIVEAVYGVVAITMLIQGLLLTPVMGRLELRPVRGEA